MPVTNLYLLELDSLIQSSLKASDICAFSLFLSSIDAFDVATDRHLGHIIFIISNISIPFCSIIFIIIEDLGR